MSNECVSYGHTTGPLLTSKHDQQGFNTAGALTWASNSVFIERSRIPVPSRGCSYYRNILNHKYTIYPVCKINIKVYFYLHYFSLTEAPLVIIMSSLILMIRKQISQRHRTFPCHITNRILSIDLNADLLL